MRSLSLMSSASLLALALSFPAAADTLELPEGAQPAATPAAYQAMLPKRGMTQAQVERHFGVPSERVPAVGDPPISRWVYGDYTVYFEHQYVLHAVLHRSR